MREAGQLTGQVLRMLAEATKPGVKVKDLDKIVRKEYAKRGAMPTFLGYHGYPATVCVSLNEELVHGIPVNWHGEERGDRVIEEGDLVSIDLGATYKGFVGDTALTIGVGEISPEAQRLIDVTRESLWCGIRAAKAGVRVGVVSGGHRRLHREPGLRRGARVRGPRRGSSDARRAAGAELRPGGKRTRPEEGHGARTGAHGDDRRLAYAAARGRLDRQHARRQPLCPL